AFEKKSTLLVSNHISALDPLTIYVHCKSHMHFLYKAELRDHKTLCKIVDWLEFVPVNRGEVDMTATKQTLRYLKENEIVAIFPEGTRNAELDCLNEFKTGAALFAIKTQTPIIPVYLWDRTKMWRKNYMIVGEEFTLEEFYDQPLSKELLTAATDKIVQNMDALRLELNEILATKGVKRRKLSKKEQRKLQEYKMQLEKEGNDEILPS
ncbi:MAG: 1-acyl-sn-glycerol-3-phosphate acyltransferase, partial [Clostridia bacterium]|nr:1-acyl-sn-glycerol-3-phosphate acyltransferase [Clostridia bacterium]